MTAPEIHPARITRQEIRGERPRRWASRPRLLLIALATLTLDGVACYFAARALGGGQGTTLLWAGAFLAILAACEFALDYYYERSRGLCYLAAALGTELILALGVLLYSSLLKTSPADPLAAVTEAGLFTVATALVTLGGCRALRAARRATNRTEA